MLSQLTVCLILIGKPVFLRVEVNVLYYEFFQGCHSSVKGWNIGCVCKFNLLLSFQRVYRDYCVFEALDWYGGIASVDKFLLAD